MGPRVQWHWPKAGELSWRGLSPKVVCRKSKLSRLSVTLQSGRFLSDFRVKPRRLQVNNAAELLARAFLWGWFEPCHGPARLCKLRLLPQQLARTFLPHPNGSAHVPNEVGRGVAEHIEQRLLNIHVSCFSAADILENTLQCFGWMGVWANSACAAVLRFDAREGSV